MASMKKEPGTSWLVPVYCWKPAAKPETKERIA
jgi:hypothetical protein